MKLSELCAHTGQWLGFTGPEIESTSRFVRQARLVSVGTTGHGAAEMTHRDMAHLFTATCGIGTARQAGAELPKWTERCPSLIEHIESCIRNPSHDTSVEFDVDGYCARFIRKDGKTKTFGERRKDSRFRSQSFLVRQIPATAFAGWLEGLRG